MIFERSSAVLTTLLFFTFAIPLIAPVFAAEEETCVPIYNGGFSCKQDQQLGLDLTIQDPQFQRYVDNLTSSQATYSPGQIVLFKITIKNKDPKKELTKILVTNISPNHLTFNSGDGKYDKDKRTITWTIDKMAGNEEKVLYAQATVNKDFPGDVTCVLNQAIVTSDKRRSQDNAGFCLDKQSVLGTKKVQNPSTSKGGLPVYQPTQSKRTPDTGPETLALFGLIPATAAGFWIRKKTTI